MTGVVGDVAHGLGVVGVVALPDVLQVQEETFHDRVDTPMSSTKCPAIAFAAHAAAQAVFGRQLLMQGAGVLPGLNRSS